MKKLDLSNKFISLNKLSQKENLEINKIFSESFKENNDIGFEEDAVIGIVSDKKNKIIAISFLLFPTDDKLKNLKTKSYANIRQQGVTQNDCYMYNFCVIKEERKKGIGNFLLKKCHEYVKQQKKQKIILYVKNDNTPAIYLYNKFGYNVHIAAPGGFIMKIILNNI